MTRRRQQTSRDVAVAVDARPPNQLGLWVAIVLYVACLVALAVLSLVSGAA